ncbi:hemerythrin domain-containing protein [Roseateles asaccharophilus]|uniref:Hemerythrin-like metal-binding protein n=1 Tax=Roseateles asaccharophilus TaxID=582607 RepID=A0ABU2A3A8_9BURK|nr:hemerythrin domain-containing protein [Roseateles asaccharophilus]MDR7331669.1 hemerythrin-like metal-binding protein [Roseateles asaccharophilus]
MTTLAWTDRLVLNQPTLDDTHEEFVGLLNAFGSALDDGVDALPAYHALLAHTEAHFAMEEDWMARCGFEAQNCHSSQHAMVLNVMREALRYATELNDREPLNILRTELAGWFPQHAEAMDAALVFTMEQRGFDPVTGECREPAAAEATDSGCGSSSCGH